MGLVHIYCGNGKGKTTAATGLAVRAAGQGKKVLFVQFYKNGSSGEIAAMKQIGGIDFAFAHQSLGRHSRMDEDQRAEARRVMCELLERVLQVADGYELIVLDESVSACNYNAIDRERLCRLIVDHRAHAEIVLTGREPCEQLVELADYVSEIQKIKHPYDRGVEARRGIEF